ncbi:hypothetical protein [Streptomyces parvus]|uniref:hypothetical protein n=1 Tax=Streptomyces parvus TaxID=66428 RepID=UPI0033E913BF
MSNTYAPNGNWYHRIQTAKGEDVYVHGDEVEFKDGALIVWRVKDDGTRFVNIAFAPGQWANIYAASVMDGHAVAVDHWDKNDNKETGK